MTGASASEGRRAYLLTLLQTRGIYRGTAERPLRRPDGSRANWMLDTLAISLTAGGARLAAQALLAKLDRFEGRQIATYGTIGIPLLESVILESGGRYRGLLVRKQVKAYGSGRRVEGPLDPDEPVVVLDDSIVSGHSALEAVRHLRAAGLWVEGAVCLVRFGYAPGVARLREAGLHVEWIFDAFREIVPVVEGTAPLTLNPTRRGLPRRWAEEPAPEGLHPCALARLVLTACVTGAPIPRAPASLAGAWDASAGVWVSVRDRADPRHRHAREGFWCLPGEPPGPGTAAAVVEAALRTGVSLRRKKATAATLEASALAVTFFDGPESVRAGDVDNERYGLLVRSVERPMRMGGALPRMPGIQGDWAQLCHARLRNAGLQPQEPYEVVRHGVTKVVEPGATWPQAGAPRAGLPWPEDANEAGRVAATARRAVVRAASGVPAAEPAANLRLPEAVEWVFVTLYDGGRIVGCAGGRPGSDGAWLPAAVEAARRDTRFGAAGGSLDPTRLAVATSFLYDGSSFGPATPEQAGPFVRRGLQAVAAFDRERTGFLLAHVAATDALTPSAFCALAKKKARIEAETCRWRRYECATWLASPERVERTEGGLPARTPQDPLPAEALTEAMAAYLRRQVRADGRVSGGLLPHRGVVVEDHSLPRTAHAAWVLARSDALHGTESAEVSRLLAFLRGRLADDGKGRAWLLPEGAVPSVSEVALSLLAWSEVAGPPPRDEIVRRLGETLAASIDRCGSISTHRDRIRDEAAYLDYYPGQAMLALARATSLGLAHVPSEREARARQWLRHRSRFARSWGQVAWVPPALCAWWSERGDARDLEAAFALCDWALWHQRPDGAFLSDQQPDTPGFTTGLYAEGIGPAIEAARASGDNARAARYLDACERALRFIDRLVLHPRDRWVLPDPAAAMGGVRQSLVSSFCRTDYTQHALSAALTLGR